MLGTIAFPPRCSRPWEKPFRSCDRPRLHRVACIPNAYLSPLSSKGGICVVELAQAIHCANKKSQRSLNGKTNLLGCDNKRTCLSLLQQLKRFVNKISAEATEFMQPSIALSLNQHLELEQAAATSWH